MKGVQDRLEIVRVHLDDLEDAAIEMREQADNGNVLAVLRSFVKAQGKLGLIAGQLVAALDGNLLYSRGWNDGLEFAAKAVEAVQIDHEQGGKKCRCAQRIRMARKAVKEAKETRRKADAAAQR